MKKNWDRNWFKILCNRNKKINFYWLCSIFITLNTEMICGKNLYSNWSVIAHYNRFHEFVIKREVEIDISVVEIFFSSFQVKYRISFVIGREQDSFHRKTKFQWIDTTICLRQLWAQIIIFVQWNESSSIVKVSFSRTCFIFFLFLFLPSFIFPYVNTFALRYAFQTCF